MAPPRHLALVETFCAGAKRVAWPVPFAQGVSELMGLRGRPVVVVASGDPFWFGAGTPLTRDLRREEWRAFPGRSTFSLAANRMGWPLERTLCLGMHAAPLSRLRPHLAPGARMILLLRDGAAVTELAGYLAETGFGASEVTVLEALGGPREGVTQATAETLAGAFEHPVCAAVTVAGDGVVLPRASGLPDALFDSDGVMTKRPVRALTLSALASRPGEHLWDIGGGSGSIGIEWLLSDPSLAATTIEPRADRIALIEGNARALGCDRLKVVQGKAPEALRDLPNPDAVFIGGGLSEALLAALEPLEARIVANAVTLESEALLVAAQARLGGTLMRVEISEVAPIGPKRGWKQAFPITQWSYP